MRTTSTLLPALLLGASSLIAGPIVGSSDAANCYPFSCFASDTGAIYQQVYNAAVFPGPLLIEALTFRLGEIDDSDLMDDAIYTVKLTTTSAAVGGLSEVPGANLGSDAAIFGTFHISGSMPTFMTLVGNPFAYNPANGNLLMQVTVDSLIAPNGANLNAFFQADETGIDTSRGFWSERWGAWANDNQALVTEFNAVERGTVFTATTNTPEPGSLIQMGLGLTCVGAGVWRRRRRGSK